MSPAAVAVAFLVSLSIAVNLVYLFRHRWTGPSRRRTATLNAVVAAYSTLYAFLAAELLVGTFFIASDNFTFTLRAERWMDLYWEPRNDERYRDHDHDADELAGRKVLFVVGDSNVAGHGIENIDDRFSDRLGDRLGFGWATFNIARNGWGTNDEFAAIVTHPRRPDAIILAYCLNDIEEAASRIGLKRPRLVSDPPRVLKWLVRHSYTLDLLYWGVLRRTYGAEMLAAYAEYRARIFADERVWAEHTRELRRILDFARAEGIALGVLVLPDFSAVGATKPLTAKVASWFATAGVPVLDLAPLEEGRPVAEMIVGPADAHPGEPMHAEIADLLLERLHPGTLAPPRAAE